MYIPWYLWHLLFYVYSLNFLPVGKIIGLDKSGNQVNSFLIIQRKDMLWVLIRSASVRHF